MRNNHFRPRILVIAAIMCLAGAPTALADTTTSVPSDNVVTLDNQPTNLLLTFSADNSVPTMAQTFQRQSLQASPTTQNQIDTAEPSPCLFTWRFNNGVPQQPAEENEGAWRILDMTKRALDEPHFTP